MSFGGFVSMSLDTTVVMVDAFQLFIVVVSGVSSNDDFAIWESLPYLGQNGVNMIQKQCRAVGCSRSVLDEGRHSVDSDEDRQIAVSAIMTIECHVFLMAV